MKNKEYGKRLNEAVKKREPLLVYLQVGDELELYDRFEYNAKENIYQGNFGYVDLGIIPKVLSGDVQYNHIRFELENIMKEFK